MQADSDYSYQPKNEIDCKENGPREACCDDVVVKGTADLTPEHRAVVRTKVRQNGPMTFKITRVLLLLAMAGSAFAAEPYEPWPSKDRLRGIEHAAYACSRDNTREACARVRQLADPLMDSQRLPGRCKDVLWTLMDEAKVASTNDFRRKDSITNTARRIPRVCGEPVKKKEKPKSRQT